MNYKLSSLPSGTKSLAVVTIMVAISRQYSLATSLVSSPPGCPNLASRSFHSGFAFCKASSALNTAGMISSAQRSIVSLFVIIRLIGSIRVQNLCAKSSRQTMPVTMATYRGNSPLISLDFLFTPVEYSRPPCRAESVHSAASVRCQLCTTRCCWP